VLENPIKEIESHLIDYLKQFVTIGLFDSGSIGKAFGKIFQTYTLLLEDYPFLNQLL